MNRCCEFNQLCRPEGWFTVPQVGGIAEKGNKKYLSVYCEKPIYEIKEVLYIVGLVEDIDTSCEYSLTICIPGNNKVKLFYSFVDSTIYLSDSRVKTQSRIDQILFDSAVVRKKQLTITFQPKSQGNYLIFKLHQFNCINGSSYYQHIKEINLSKTNHSSPSMDVINKRIRQIYDENRAHYFDANCPEKTIK